MNRFWSKAKRVTEGPKTGCLEWTGSLKKPCSRDFRAGGQALQHGTFWFDGRKVYAHRMAVSLVTGVDIDALPLIGHECDNPKCVEPMHLVFSDYSTNLKEAWDRGRRATSTDRNLRELSEWFDANPVTLEAP